MKLTKLTNFTKYKIPATMIKLAKDAIDVKKC